jgi:predicted O-linked N-acetylglucosamine transferase (SPINDLY family)
MKPTMAQWACNEGSGMRDLIWQELLRRAMQDHQAGRLEAAESGYAQLLANQPDNPALLHLTGVLYLQMNRADKAATYLQRAVSIKADFPEAHNNLGVAAQKLGNLDLAIAAFQRACDLRRDYVAAIYNLGTALQSDGQTAASVAAFRRVIQLNPGHVDARSNLGNALRNLGDLGGAAELLSEAVALQPRNAIAHNNLGNVLKDQGKIDQALAAFHRAIELDPSFCDAHTNLLLTLHYSTSATAAEIFRALREWDQAHAASLTSLLDTAQVHRYPNRPLRVGYLSADFRDHAVCRFALPLVTNHDPRQFEVFCYANVSSEDGMSQCIRDRVGAWRNIFGKPDDDVAQRIREDQIDILVDLSGHTAGNRLLVFARRPAPVQVTYLGFPASTGMRAMDYRFTDALADPPGASDAVCSETLIRIPDCAWCFGPPDRAPEPGDLPAMSRGWITFGSFNNFAKVNPPLLQRWAQILLRVRKSRLLIKAQPFSSPRMRADFCRMMEDFGVTSDRLDLRGWVPAADHLAQYRDIDIGLDTFPYHGTTTTCEALYMGVPLVTLAGQSHVARVGVSLLTAVGLPHLICSDFDQYVEVAARLASDLETLRDIRSSLRRRMANSPLMDAPSFARKVEAAYHQMWHAWCK